MTNSPFSVIIFSVIRYSTQEWSSQERSTQFRLSSGILQRKLGWGFHGKFLNITVSDNKKINKRHTILKGKQKEENVKQIHKLLLLRYTRDKAEWHF